MSQNIKILRKIIKKYLKCQYSKFQITNIQLFLNNKK